jgi:hypothetical protein
LLKRVENSENAFALNQSPEVQDLRFGSFEFVAIA